MITEAQEVLTNPAYLQVRRNYLNQVDKRLRSTDATKVAEIARLQGERSMLMKFHGLLELMKKRSITKVHRAAEAQRILDSHMV